MCPFWKNDGPAIFLGAVDGGDSATFSSFFPWPGPPPGGMTAFRLRGGTNEIPCANGAELRDNHFNPGGLAIWDGIGQMNRQDQFEAEVTAAVSGLPISCYEVVCNPLIQ
jgi:hypothetical protein